MIFETTKTFMPETQKFLDETYTYLTEHECWQQHYGHILNMLGSDLDLMAQCDEDIRTHGITCINSRNQTAPNPACQIRSRAHVQILSCIQELGLSLKTKKHVKADAKEEENPLLEFIR